jgi:SulP family sulfate permease
VAWNMSEVKHFASMLIRAPQADRVILLTTFFLTVFADLVVAVNVGVMLAVLQFLRRMAQSVDAQPISSRALESELADLGITALPSRVLVYEIAGPMFFGAVENFRRALLEARPQPTALIIRLDRVPFMDMTGLLTLQEVIEQLGKRGVMVLLCEANARVLGKLHTAGILPGAAAGSIYRESLREALLSAGIMPKI